MPFVFWNVSDVSVSNFYIRDPQLWAINIMNGTNMAFANITVNATAPSAPRNGTNWIQNTDGFDTMDANNILLENFVYQGGDDCVAIKPRSYNVKIRNVTCYGGNGIAIGSLGQYLEDSSVENVVIDGARLIRNEWLHGSALIKTWVGVLVNQSSRSYESAYVPRGAGWGGIRNRAFQGSSLMEISNVVYANWTGYLHLDEGANETAGISCSKVHPCYNLDFKNVSLAVAENSTNTGTGACKFVEAGGVHGLKGIGC
jgi:galacturan 1,4-alpha-galacturonidase